MEKGVERWMVDISKWNPSPRDFSAALSALPQQEHPSITRFVKLEDRKRALVSRLLQYTLVHEVLGIPYDKIVIKRTLEGKPYSENGKLGSRFPNFNFNVSHHGDFVAIASEPLCLVGVDIVCCIKPQRKTVPEFIQSFTSYFSSLEWHMIVTAGTDDEILAEFYRYWCLKEAYVKAIGSGVAYGLDKVEFHHTNWTNISIKIDGQPVKQWKFWLSEHPKKHWVSVARGHPRSAVESYKRALSLVELDQDEYYKAIHLPEKKFVIRTVEQLIPAPLVMDTLVKRTKT
uniref:holo-[acyl-carrier-protein] synthase n=2 Tax=Rhizophora mucronata TaxID=61149 RepID=A0A2P2J885_RHIMU